MGIMSIRKMAQKLLAPVILVLVVTLVIGVFYIGFPNVGGGGDNATYKGPVAKVNGEMIKDADFNNYLMSAMQQAMQYAQYGLTSSPGETRDKALTSAIRNTLFKQLIKKVGSKVKVSNEEVDLFIKERWPTEEELESLMLQANISSKKELRKQVLQYLEQQKFISYKARELKMEVPKAEVEERMEQITVSHILVGLNTSDGQTRTDAEALKRADEVFQKATSGGDFAALAKEYSDDPSSKDKGGVYGPMPLDNFKTDMVKEFVDGSLALKPGEISKPIKTEYGYHIIRLDLREMPKDDKGYQKAEDELLVQKAQDTQSPYSQWFEEQVKEASLKTEILDPALRAYRLQSEQKWAEAAQAYEKALKKPYYKNQLDVYLSASEACIQQKNPKNAIEVLKKIPGHLENIESTIALAKAYKEDGNEKEAETALKDFGTAHPDDKEIHEKLKTTFTEMGMTEAAANEEKAIAEILKNEEEALKRYQQNLDQKQGEQQSESTTP